MTASPSGKVGWAILAAAVLLSLFVRLRLREFPLERDEGEYAYAGQLILEGIPPYSLACNMKLPGTYLAYAGLMAVFGQDAAGIHLGLAAVNMVTIVMVFFFLRELFDPLTGACAAAAYSLLALSPSVLGQAAHATHFVALFGLAGSWALWRAMRGGGGGSCLASGILMGVAFLMKQQGVFLILFGGAMVLLAFARRRPFSRRRLLAGAGLYAAGAVLPYAGTCLWLWHAGVFASFWFWTFQYAMEYASRVPWSLAPRYFREGLGPAIGPNWPIWALAGAGMVALGFVGKSREGLRPFLYGMLLSSFLCVCPGLYFRWHYFIVMLPAVAALAGVGSREAWRLACRGPAASHSSESARPVPPPRDRQEAGPRKSTSAPRTRRAGLLAGPAMVLLLAAGLFPVWRQWDFCFSWTPQTACRNIYGPNPFLESPVIADYLSRNSTPDQRVAVLGSEPEIYFYARRKSATSYIYTYGLMEAQPFALAMQEEMARQIEAAKPEFIVYVNVDFSWFARSDSNLNILRWADQYVTNFYRLVGIVDILPLDQTEYRWDEQAMGYQPRSRYFLKVYRRRA